MRAYLPRLLLATVLLGTVAWIASCTEWKEVEVPRPAQGEAAENPYYAVQHVVRGLGAEVMTPQSLDRMPGPNDTLLLMSSQWDIFPERAERLRAWVAAGGHLVIPTHMLDDETLAPWLPIALADEDDDEEGDEEREGVERVPPEEEADPDDAMTDDPDALPAFEDRPAMQVRAQAGPGMAMAVQRKLGSGCHVAIEPEGMRPYFRDSERVFEVCAYGGDAPLVSAQAPLWGLYTDDGHEVLRSAYGRGTVTVMSPWDLLSNSSFLRGDNALVASAILQPRPGIAVWFVAEEARPPLLVWLWDEARVAVLLGLLALSLALWRGGARFGPLAAVSVPVRRSMTEQITGTAQFLRAHGMDALCQAQRRALEDMARTHLREFAGLNLSDRAQAIARATGLDAQALAQALDARRKLSRGEFTRAMELLETARRLLRSRSRERARGRPASPPVR